MSRRLPQPPDGLTFDGMGGQFFCPKPDAANAAMLQLPKDLWPRPDPAEIHFMERLWFGDALMDVLEFMLVKGIVKRTPATEYVILRIGGSTFTCSVTSPIQNARAGLAGGVYRSHPGNAVHVDSLPEQMQVSLLPLLVVTARVQAAIDYFTMLQGLTIPAAVAARWLHPALKNDKPIPPARGAAGERWVRFLMERRCFDPADAVRHGAVLRASLLLWEMGRDRKNLTTELDIKPFRVRMAEIKDLAEVEGLAAARGVL